MPGGGMCPDKNIVSGFEASAGLAACAIDRLKARNRPLGDVLGSRMVFAVRSEAEGDGPRNDKRGCGTTEDQETSAVCATAEVSACKPAGAFHGVFGRCG